MREHTRWKKQRTNLIHITTVSLTYSSRLDPAHFVLCVCRLNESPFSTHTLIQFLMLSAKNHRFTLSLSPRMLHRPLYSRIATTMNIPRRARTTTVVAPVATKNENENGKIAESFTTLHEQQKLIQEPHMWCAHEKPSFYLFSDVIFFYFVCVCCCCCWCCCFFVFRIRFKNKVPFFIVSR